MSDSKGERAIDLVVDEGPGRLTGFSDGVLAVIITIMAFDLKPPAGYSLTSLSHRVPALLIYILSFTTIGIYWNNHHHLLRATKRVGAAVMWSNLLLLFFLSLIPVLTQWVSIEYHHSLPAIVYGIDCFLAGVAYTVLVSAIVRTDGPDSVVARMIGFDVKGAFSSIGTLLGAGLAFVSPWISYLIYAVVTLSWFIPDRRLALDSKRSR